MYLQHFDHFETCKIPEDLVRRAEEIRYANDQICEIAHREIPRLAAQKNDVPDSYKCKACRKKFKTQGGFTVHRRYHCKVDRDPSYGGKQSDPDLGKILDNDVTIREQGSVDSSITSKNPSQSLTVHMEKHCPLRAAERESTNHNQEILAAQEDTPDSFQCEACKKICKTQAGYTIHRRYHCKVGRDPKYGGKHNMQFESDPDFEMTLENDVTMTSSDGPEEEYLQCRLCETYCSNPQSLSVHMEKYCPLRSVEQQSANHNQEIFKFNCELCLQPFVTKPALTTHRRYHCRIQKDPDYSGIEERKKKNTEKDIVFKCEFCDRPFKAQSALTSHQRYHCLLAESSRNENGSNNDSSDDCPDLSPNSSQNSTEDEVLDDDVIDLNALEKNSEQNVRPEEQIIFESAFHIETDSESEDEADDDADGSRPSSGYGTESSSNGKSSPTSDEDMFHISNDDFTLPEDEKSPSSPSSPSTPPSKRPILDDILDEIADHHETLSSKVSDDQPVTKKPKLSTDVSEIDQSIPKNRVCAFCGLVGKTPAQIRRHEAQVHLNPNKYRGNHKDPQLTDITTQADISKERIINFR